MFYRLLAIVFPPGYRLVAINAIALLCSAGISDYYARSFFMISLLATFSGFAVSSQSYVSNRSISLTRRSFLTLILLAAVSLPGFIFWENGVNEYLVVFVAALGYSLFEIIRSDLAAKGKFNTLFYQGVIAIFALLFVVYQWRQSASVLVILSFWVLPFSAIIFAWNESGGRDKITLPVVKDVASYSLSNGLSTGLASLLPLLLEKDLGSGSLTELAQVVTISSIFLLYPRYLSAGFMVDLQKKQDKKMVDKFEKLTIGYVLAVSFLYVLACILFFPEYKKYSIFVIALLASQIALPFSNVHSVLGFGHQMLRVNLGTTVIFCSALFLMSAAYGQGLMRAYIIMSLYFGYIVLRNNMTKRSCMNILKNNLSN